MVSFNNNGSLVDAEADPNQPAAANLTVHATNNTAVGSGPNEDTGSVLLIDNPQLGSALNTVINKNRFDHVMLEVLSGPHATATLTADASGTSMWEKSPVSLAVSAITLKIETAWMETPTRFSYIIQNYGYSLIKDNFSTSDIGNPFSL